MNVLEIIERISPWVIAVIAVWRMWISSKTAVRVHELDNQQLDITQDGKINLTREETVQKLIVEIARRSEAIEGLRDQQREVVAGLNGVADSNRKVADAISSRDRDIDTMIVKTNTLMEYVYNSTQSILEHADHSAYVVEGIRDRLLKELMDFRQHDQTRWEALFLTIDRIDRQTQNGAKAVTKSLDETIPIRSDVISKLVELTEEEEKSNEAQNLNDLDSLDDGV